MPSSSHPPSHSAQLLDAITAALADDWDTAHNIAQDHGDAYANWIHAVLHKIEGDAWNSRYWYARSGGRQYEDYTDPQAELHAIAAALKAT